MSFLSPAHVAGLSSHTRAVIVKAFWIKSALGRGRVLQDITGFNRPRTNPVRKASVAVLPFGNVIATGFSRLWRKLARGSSTPNLALLGPLLSQLRLICEFFRTPKAAGKPFSFIRIRRQHLGQSGSVAGVLFSPFNHSAEPLFLGLIALSDGHRVAKGNSHVRHETGQI